MKKKIIYILSGLFIILLITYIIFNNRINIKFKDNLKFEINSNIYFSDLIEKIENGNIINNKEKIDTSTLGDKKINIIVKDKYNNKKIYPVIINIYDSTKPIIDLEDIVTINVNQEINLLNYINASDNSKDEVSLKIDGEYDINKVGKYELNVEAVDKSGNKSEKNFILNVIQDNQENKTKNGYIIKNIDGVTYIDDTIIVNKKYKLPKNYGDGLKEEVNKAFNEMKKEASSFGLNIYISSGFRSYDEQDKIYNRYLLNNTTEEVDRFSARAGYSEHQTGLAVDLNTIKSSFSKTDEGIWVNNNCYLFGFIIRYPENKENITGYMYEPWHIRYVGNELANKLYNNGNWITLEEYYGISSEY